MIKIVPGTNIIISAIFWRGNPYKVMLNGFKGKYILVISPQILEELIHKLKYKFKLPEDKIQEYVDLLLTFCHIIQPNIELNIIKEDPSDNKILECALVGNVNYIVSGDSHLLKLKEFKGIKILRAIDILKIR